ncbi:DUF835 domain-containing protein [Candidatus Woesearchaeota archaeon]|nr:MAG: DUF835 domain-containing protein [Candidatus Woesearchaeota archaeon]
MGGRIKEHGPLLLLLLSLFIVGLIIFSNFLSFMKIQAVVVDLLAENQHTQTIHAAGRMENHILQVKDELLALSKVPAVSTLGVESCSDTPHEWVSTTLDAFMRADKDGDIVACTSKRFSGFLGLNIKNKDYFTQPRDTGEPFIAGTFGQDISPQIIVSVPIFARARYTPLSRYGTHYLEEFNGTLFTIIDLDYLYNLYIHPYVRAGKNSFLFYDVATGETLLKSPDIEPYEVLKDKLPIGDELVVGFDTWGETIITSSEIILGSKRFRLIILTPLKEASEDMVSLQYRHLFSLFFILTVGIIMTVFLVRLFKSREEAQAKLRQASITLERYGIQGSLEEAKYADADVSLASGKVYLIKEEGENHAHELFISSLNKGYVGLGVIRENPAVFRERYNLEKTALIWMTKAKPADVPAETDIRGLYTLIAEFVQKNEKCVILLDRMDYLISENDFATVVRVLHSLNDLILHKDCIIILSVNPRLVSEAQLGALEAEAIDYYGKQLEKRVALSEKELGILRYINEQNVKNKLVTYGAITAQFKITKPTTRVRIQKLADLGLVRVEQVGRFKSLKVTSAGRRVLR